MKNLIPLSPFHRRLKEILDRRKNEWWAEKLDCHPSTVRDKWKKGKSWPEAKYLIIIGELFDISFDWLIMGKESLNAYFDLIPEYESMLSEESGELVEVPKKDRTLAINKKELGRHGQPESLVFFKNTGDSMSPKINDGDMVLVDCSKSDPSQILNGKIYAFTEGGMVNVKYLAKQGGKIRIISENKTADPDYDADIDNFNLIGLVVWIGHVVR